MRQILFLLITMFISWVFLSCISTKADKNNIIIITEEITEEIISEFKSNKDGAKKKYKGQRFQMVGEIVGIFMPIQTFRFLGLVESLDHPIPLRITMEKDYGYFGFDFDSKLKIDYDATRPPGHAPSPRDSVVIVGSGSLQELKIGDTIVIQGAFSTFSRSRFDDNLYVFSFDSSQIMADFNMSGGSGSHVNDDYGN